jgi:hypothetical protein
MLLPGAQTSLACAPGKQITLICAPGSTNKIAPGSTNITCLNISCLCSRASDVCAPGSTTVSRACAPGSTSIACLCPREHKWRLSVLPEAQTTLICAPSTIITYLAGSTRFWCSREHKQATFVLPISSRRKTGKKICQKKKAKKPNLCTYHARRKPKEHKRTT